MSEFQRVQQDAQLLSQYKQDANLLRSNEPLQGAEALGQQYLAHQHLGNQPLGTQSYGGQQILGNQPMTNQSLINQPLGQGQTLIQQAENEIRNIEAKVGIHGQQQNIQGAGIMNQGSPSRMMQGSPTRMMQGSPTRYVQGGSPTGILSGSPHRQTGFNQSLGQYTGQSLATGAQYVQSQNPQQQVHIHTTADYTTTQAQAQAPTMLQQQQFVSGGQNYIAGETIVEKIYEAPIVVTHQEQAIIQERYEGREKLFTQEGAVYESHQNAPIVKEIHQDIIHEHHKDVLVEHKKDILHEHHQDIIHEHHQPIIYEKHIHEHHQPIIHEKHTTLIEEKHVPIIHEQHSQQTNVQERDVVTEVFEAPVTKEVFVEPVIHEVYSDTIIEKQSSQFSGQNQQFNSQNQQFISQGIQNQGYVSQGVVQQNPGQVQQKVLYEETITSSNQPGTTGYIGQGTGAYNQGAYLGEEQVYGTGQQELDEFGRPKKQGFFKNLKSKMTGHHKDKEPKHL